MKLWWCFVISWIFLQFFLEFSITGQEGTHRKDFFFLFSLFLGLSQPNLVRKDAMIVFSDFLNFFLLFFWNFLLRVGQIPIKTIFFYFFSFSPFSNLFWLEKKLCWCFQIFWIFLLFFLEFSITGRVLTRRNDFFFLSFSTFPNLFWLGKKLWLCFLIFWIFSLFF